MPIVKLPIDLSDADVKVLAVQLAEALDRKESVEREKKIAMDDFKSQIDALTKRIHELKESVRNGRGEVETEVDERPGVPGIIDLFRKGTDEKVGERPMSDADRQGNLPLAAAAGNDVERSDEQENADSPEDAERMRIDRLEAEHNEAIDARVAAAAETVVLTPLDEGFMAEVKILDGGPVGALQATGDTEDDAKAAVLKMFRDMQPEFERPVTWADVQAASAEVAEEQAADDGAVDAAGSLAEPSAAADEPKAPEDGPRVGLQVPKNGPKPKRARRHRIQDAVATEEAPADAPTDADASAEDVVLSAGGDDVPVTLCPPECDIDHDHSEERTGF
jgi:hypothetical protein